MARGGESSVWAGRTRLRIGEREMHIDTEAEQGEALHWRLDLGTQTVAGGQAFRHEPPTALEIEHAIEHTEDAVMPLWRQLPVGTQLHTDDASAQVLLELARARVPGQPHALSLEDVEAVFNELASLAQGRPPSSSFLPAQAALAAYLVMLREVMHHLRFTSIHLD